MEKFGINVTKLEYILMCLKNHIVVAKCPKKIPHFDTINYHVYSELSHVYFGFSSSRTFLSDRTWPDGGVDGESNILEMPCSVRP